MADYSGFQDMALRMIRENGYKALLRRGGEYDFNADVTGSGGEWTCDALNDHKIVERAVQAGAKAADGTLIVSTDIGVLIPALDLGTAPQVGDAFIVGDAAYKIERVTPTNPGNVDILFEVVARA